MIIAIKKPGKELVKRDVTMEELKELKKGFTHGLWDVECLSHPHENHLIIMLVGDVSSTDGSKYNFKYKTCYQNTMAVRKKNHECLFISRYHCKKERYTGTIFGNALFLACAFDSQKKMFVKDLEDVDIRAIKEFIRKGSDEPTLLRTPAGPIKAWDGNSNDERTLGMTCELIRFEHMDEPILENLVDGQAGFVFYY